MTPCTHGDAIATVEPGSRGCEECLETGGRWVNLRLCRSCGHVGCCDQSPGRHVCAYFHKTGHPIIEATTRPKVGAGATSTTR